MCTKASHSGTMLPNDVAQKWIVRNLNLMLCTNFLPFLLSCMVPHGDKGKQQQQTVAELGKASVSYVLACITFFKFSWSKWWLVHTSWAGSDTLKIWMSSKFLIKRKTLGSRIILFQKFRSNKNLCGWVDWSNQILYPILILIQAELGFKIQNHSNVWFSKAFGHC